MSAAQVLLSSQASQAAQGLPASAAPERLVQAARSVQALFPRLVQAQAPPEFLLPQVQALFPRLVQVQAPPEFLLPQAP